MGEHDWLERGHGGGESLQPMIKGSAAVVAARASIRSVLRGTNVPMAPRRPTRRRTKALVGWMLYCCTAVGGTAAAFTVRDTLFPSLGGSPTAQPLWGDRPVESTPSTDDASTSSAKTDSTVTESTAVATTVATTRSSIDEQSVASIESQSGKGTNTTDTVDDHGNGGNAPATGTTVVEAADDPGTTVTTVDDHGPNTSTAPTASNPGSSVDPTATSASTPASSPDTGHQDGKGGGSGGGGGGSSGGPPPSP